MSKHKTLELADRIGGRIVRNWVHATGQTPRANGYRNDPECQDAADTIRAQHALIEQMRDALGKLRDECGFGRIICETTASTEAKRALAAADQYLKGEQS